MSSFNLLALPDFPLSHVLKQMTIQNLINLSFEQEDIQNFLKMIPIRSGGYTVTLDEDGICIQMNEQPFAFQRFDANKSVLFDVLDQAYEHLEKTFPGGIKKLEISPLSFPDHLDRIPIECDILSIGKESEFDDYNIDYIEECSDEMIDSLIQQTNFKMGLKLNGLMKTENSKMFNVDFLKIFNSGWVTPLILHRLHNKIVHLQYSSLIDLEINEFLKNLKNGTGNNRLEVMTIEKEDGCDMDLILDRLNSTFNEKQTFKMDEERRKLTEEFLPYHIGIPLNLYDAYDFTTHDKRRVSVALVESTLSSSIRVFVWPKEV